jgi:hypothetical protein
MVLSWVNFGRPADQRLINLIIKVLEIPCEKLMGPLTLSKDTLREEGIPWLIKCLGKRNFSDVRYFNTPPHVWQLMTKHMDNNGRERPTMIIARNL